MYWVVFLPWVFVVFISGASYQEEGFSHIYIACAGSNTQHFINMLKDMFGKVDELDLEELETPATKLMRTQVATAEEADVALKEGPVPEDGTMRVIVTQVPVPLEFGLQPDMYPVSDPVKEISKKDPKKKTTSFTICAKIAPSLLKTKSACICMPADVSI